MAQALNLDLAPARDSEGNVRPRTITATWNPVPGADSYTLSWQRVGQDPQAQSQQRGAASGPSAQGANQLTVSDERTGADFTVPDDGEYRAKLQANGEDNEVIAQDGAEVNQAPDQTDTTPPRMVRGEIDGNIMTIYFSEPLDETATGGRFYAAVQKSGYYWHWVNAYSSNMVISGNKVTVDFGSNLQASVGRGASGAYLTKPGVTTLRDLAGNVVRSPHDWRGGWRGTWCLALNNLTSPASAPSFQSAAAYPHWLSLTFDETLDGNSVPAGGAFTVTVKGSEVSLASADPVHVSGDTVTLVLASEVAAGDDVTVTYAKPSGSPLRAPGGTVNGFSGEAATNLVGVAPSVSEVAISSVPNADDTYAFGETIRVKVTFTEAVDVETTGGRPRLRIKMAPGYGAKWADYAGGTGTNSLTFDYTVAEPDSSTQGVAVLRGALELNGGAIRSAATATTDAHLWNFGLDHDSNHMVDWRRSGHGIPWVTSVAITSDPGDDGTYRLGDTIQVTATFGEAVNVDTTGGTPRLKIRMAPHFWWFDTDDGERWANYAGGTGTAELAFEYTVTEANRSIQGVAALRSGMDLNGGTIRSVSVTPTDAHLRYEGLGHDRDHRVDGRTPSLLSVTVQETTVAISYGEALDADAVPPARSFTVQRTPQGGAQETVSVSGPPEIAGGAVMLTLANPVLETDTDVKVSYTKPTAAANRLMDPAGNEAESFTGQAADPGDTTRPRLEWGQIDGDTMTIFFSEALDEDLAGNGDHFHMTLHPQSNGQYGQCHSGVPWSLTAEPRDLYVRGNTAVVVGLYGSETVRAIVDWMIVPLQYIADVTVARRLRDLASNPVSTPIYHSSGHQNTRPIYLENVTELPSPERVMVDGDRLTLTFDAPMDGNSKPAASAFTVKVNGSAVSLASSNPVAVSGREVTLTLAAAVAAGDDVTVSYERPLSKWLRNVICEYAESFSDKPVPNFTGVSPAAVAIISDPGDDDTYALGDVVRVRLTFTGAVTVDGEPRLKIKMDPDGEEFWANYEGGDGTNALTFAYTVVEPDISPQGIAVVANTLELRYGALRYTSSGGPAYLEHRGLGHDASHKVYWWAAPPGVPHVSGAAITSDAGGDDTYGLGAKILVTLTFSEAVDVTGAPRLKIKMGPNWGEYWANYEGGAGTNTLTFAYRVAEPNSSPRGIAVLEHSLDLNGGAIRSAATATEAHLLHAGLGHDPNHKVDWRRLEPGVPAVWLVAISSSPFADGAYALGQTIRVRLTFSEEVDVTGAPRLRIKMDPNWGEFWANYEGGSGTTSLTFAYTVVEPNTSSRGIAVLKNSLDLNGGAIRAAATATTDAHLQHKGRRHDPNHRVDWRQPGPEGPWATRVLISSFPAADGTYGFGETIRVILKFSEAVNVAGTPRLKIELGPGYGERWADYDGGTGTSTLVFAHTVAESDRSTRGIAVLRNSLDLNGGAIRSAATATTDAHLRHRGLNHNRNHKVDWRRSEPGVPWITGVAITSDPGDDDTYRLGETIQVTVTFSEAMTVDDTGGKPRLGINLDPDLLWGDWVAANNRWADYAGGSGAELTFAYQVAEGDRSLRGVLVRGNTLELNGGTIRSATAMPTDAHLRHEGLGRDWNHRVDGQTPALLSVTVHETTVAISYGEALDAEAVPPASAFTVQRTPQGGAQETVAVSGTPEIAGGAVILTLASPVLATDTDVKVSYGKPAAANRVKDKAGNEVAEFTGQAADPTDTTQPRLERGEIDGGTFVLYFSEALDEDSVGGHYRVTLWGGNGISFTASGEVEIIGNTVSVGLGSLRADPGENARVQYRVSSDPAGARLRDLAGNAVLTPHTWTGGPGTRRIHLDNFTVPP